MKYLIILTILFGCSGVAPKVLGTKDGKLYACPTSPNCVCSEFEKDSKHYIEPIAFSATWENFLEKVEGEGLVVTQKKNYLHIIYLSSIFRFVDDVEFLYHPQKGEIAIRSSSRSGHYDFKVNRKRMEAFRKKLL